MRLLLDTHVLIWWLRDDQRLGPRARSMIAHHEVDVVVSVASCWEAALKHRIGKMEESGSRLWHMALDEGFELIGIESAHIVEFEGLALHADHRDPYDHLLLAQAKAEGAALMTQDRQMTRYGVPCIGVR